MPPKKLLWFSFFVYMWLANWMMTNPAHLRWPVWHSTHIFNPAHTADLLRINTWVDGQWREHFFPSCHTKSLILKVTARGLWGWHDEDTTVWIQSDKLKKKKKHMSKNTWKDSKIVTNVNIFNTQLNLPFKQRCPNNYRKLEGCKDNFKNVHL